MEIELFVFSVESFDFLNFMKKRPNLTKQLYERFDRGI